MLRYVQINVKKKKKTYLIFIKNKNKLITKRREFKQQNRHVKLNLFKNFTLIFIKIGQIDI